MSRPDAKLEAEIFRTIDGLNAGDEHQYVEGWRYIKFWLADGNPEIDAQERLSRMALLLKGLHDVTWGAKYRRLKAKEGWN